MWVKTTGWWNLSQGKATGYGITLPAKVMAEITVLLTLHPVSTWLFTPHLPAFSLVVTYSRKPSLTLKMSLGPLSYVLPASCLPPLQHSPHYYLCKVCHSQELPEASEGWDRWCLLPTSLGVLAGKANYPFPLASHPSPPHGHTQFQMPLFIFQRPAKSPGTQFACSFLLLCLHLLIYVANDLKSNTRVHQRCC